MLQSAKRRFIMNRKSNQLKVWEAAALCALCISLCIGTWAQARQQSISASLVRLHVIAVSDDEAEQALKLRVRDAVLEYLSPKLEGVETAQQARRIISAELEGIGAAAAAVSEGRTVTVSLGEENYPTREYAAFTLPAGRYESLRVTLGEGKGHNWWCVVFPPVCLSAAESEEVRQVMSEEDYAIITGEEDHQIRFRLVELWGELMSMIDK